MTTAGNIRDALIIGAGPAGISCAVWLARLGLRPIVFDAADQVGGLCRGNPFPDPWTLLLPDADGDAVARQLERSVADASVELRLSTGVEHIERQAGHFVVSGAGWAPVAGAAAVLATGVRPRGWQLGRDAQGKPLAGIVVGPGGEVARQSYAGKRVAILGGGDNAYENALYVAERDAAEVTLYCRSVRAQQQLQERVPQAWVRRGAYAFDPAARSVAGRSYDLILVFYGWEPALGPAQHLSLALDAGGFVATERYTAQTSVPGVYAIGELTRRQHPCVLTAMADGVVAAKAIQARREDRAC